MSIKEPGGWLTTFSGREPAHAMLNIALWRGVLRAPLRTPLLACAPAEFGAKGCLPARSSD